MSVDLLWEYVLSGKSEGLADLVQNHIIEDDFCPETLGIEYPEYLDLENPHGCSRNS